MEFTDVGLYVLIQFLNVIVSARFIVIDLFLSISSSKNLISHFLSMIKYISNYNLFSVITLQKK